MKTIELTGNALDWAVAKCEDVKIAEDMAARGIIFFGFNYSKDWNQGGPIIEREKIEIRPGSNGTWFASIHSVYMFMEGDTPLEAAMRCLVAAYLGDEVTVPQCFRN